MISLCVNFMYYSFIVSLSLTFKLNQSYPTIYAEDSKEIEGDLEKVVPIWGTIRGKEVEETKNLWDTTFDQPYEKAGGGIVLESEVISIVNPPIYWDVSDTDLNTKYKSMLPRFLLEVSHIYSVGNIDL